MFPAVFKFSEHWVLHWWLEINATEQTWAMALKRTNHGRFESIADSQYQQQARQNSGWMHYGHHSCTRASGTLTIEKDWGVREDMPGILQREPCLYFTVNSMIGESILRFSNCEAQRTQGTHREQELEKFARTFFWTFYASQLLQRAKTQWEVGFHIKPMSLGPRPTRLHPKLGKKTI